MFKPVNTNVNFPELERAILNYWEKEGIVEKYLHKNDKEVQHFSFFDGPITANNPMGIHHGWGRTYKDLWQRYHNMKGCKQRFQNGFDCQGLWVEVEVEKELKLKTKKEIENLIPGDKKASIAKFVDLCRGRVRKYAGIQTEQSKRLGYFMDWKNSYYTMSDENNYMIWYFLKVCNENGWIYKGHDSVPWCPRCETAISQHEMLTEDYKELTHETVFLKLRTVNFKLRTNIKNIYLLIWTTTPWTIPANVAVGVNVKYTYAIWEHKGHDEAVIIVDKDENNATPMRLLKGKEIPVSEYIFRDTDGEFVKIGEIPGSELLGIKYQGLFDELPRIIKAKNEHSGTFHTVVDGSEIVVATEGTGLLHIAPGAGKEDFDLGVKENLSVISVIGDDAAYLPDMNEFSGKNAKKHPELIIDHLRNYGNGRYLLRTMPFTHRYPACWRCKTELVWKVADEWYIAMDRPCATAKASGDTRSHKATAGKVNNKTLRERMIDVAKEIKWIPEFGLDRELDWLNNMHDWLISKKNRYWGLALPIFECKPCKWFDIVGSKEELKTRATSGWSAFENHSPHKPWIDEIKIRCPECNQEAARIDDVGNPWLDAGIISFSTLSYTTDKKYWREWFPADFITESFPGQFKNWFYSLIAMATVLENINPFQAVLGFATLLGEDGKPMHKSWGNSIEFNEAADKIGVDVMRWMYVTQNPVENLLFGYKNADHVRRRFHLKLWNIYNFFISNAIVDNWVPQKITAINSSNVLDKWITERLNKVIFETKVYLDNYNAFSASLNIEKFVEDLSVWYVRRIRERVGPTVENQRDKNLVYSTLHSILTVLSRILAPFIPFISEEIFRNLTGEDSVHLANWPKLPKNYKPDDKLLGSMELVRNICELGHAARKEKAIRVRQPLRELRIKNYESRINEEFLKLIQDEINIKEIKIIGGSGELAVELDTELTTELIAEGQARELVRQIQLKRKELGCRLTDRVRIKLPDWPKSFSDYIKKETLTESITTADTFQIEKAGK